MKLLNKSVVLILCICFIVLLTSVVSSANTYMPTDIDMLKNIDDAPTPIRVGVMYIYGSNNCLAFGHNISSDNGLMFYSKTGENYNFFMTSSKPVSVIRDLSAAKNSSNKYYFTTEGNSHKIYHAVTKEPVSIYNINEKILAFEEVLGVDAVIFPLFIDDKIYVAVNTYGSIAESDKELDKLQDLLGEEFVSRIPNNTSISVVETETGRILFKIDTASSPLYVRPVQNEAETYIKSSVGNIFDGTFEYKTSADGLYLTNILELDDYVKSVLPYEISSTWPEESLKAFSVVVRSYTLAMMDQNHRKQDFDMCDETHCQVYRGRLRSTEKTDKAVEETKDTVLAYDGKVCETYYSAVAGGFSESSKNVWGTDIPYLTEVAIPDEDYESHANGVWSTTVTKDELFSYLESNSTVSSQISGKIAKVEITEYTDAGYAYKLEITDVNGKVCTVSKCDNIRILLSKYCKSARISIGKTAYISVNTSDNNSKIDIYNFYCTDKNGKAVRYKSDDNSIGNQKPKAILTAKGTEYLTSSDETYTISGTGWGHGVGFSQHGAKSMANKGYSWDRIATYFFNGAYLANLNELNNEISTITNAE